MQNNLSAYFGSARFQSFLLHAAAIGAVAGLGDLASNLGAFTLPSWAAALIGIGLAQAIQGITGWVNNHPVPKGLA